MNVLQQIFTDYYEEIEYTLHPRKTEMENIDKMIHCGDPSFGGAMYGCPHSGKLEVVVSLAKIKLQFSKLYTIFTYLILVFRFTLYFCC